jgi:hypothetical protein
MSGGAVLSTREYQSGEFEFKLKPSMASGITTVVGLANDGPRHADPFFQLVFNSDLYGKTAFAVQMGGGPNLFGAGSSVKEYTVNMSDIGFFLIEWSLSSLGDNAINYKINHIPGDGGSNPGSFEVYVASSYDLLGAVTSYQKVFPNAASANDDLSLFLATFPNSFNVHAAAWYNSKDNSADDSGHSHGE